MKRYALIIGMSVYDSPHLVPLPKTVPSAEAIAQVLEQYGNFQEVRRLPAHWVTGDRAEVAAAAVTEQELVREIKYVLQQAELGEALIYFSGHGFVVADSFDNSKAYLAASNTQIDLTTDQVIGQRQGISLESLSKELFHANLSSLVLLLDCCHAGSVISQESVQASLAQVGERDYTLLAACRAFEKAYAGDGNSPYSIFTDALIRGLNKSQANDRGVVSSDRLADAVNEFLALKGQEALRMSFGRPIPLVHHPLAPSAPEQTTEVFKAENPYRGLYSFEERHAALFFGRESAIWDVVRRVGENRFLAVMGASGCGKSSLVKAGVVPKLRQNSVPGSAQWQIAIFTPGRNPHQRLMASLEKLSDDRPILLIIDQFEEVFTLCEDEREKEQFMRLITHQVNQKAPELRVVVTIRGDFLDRCADYEIADLINKSRPTGYVVRPLAREELMAAIAQPAVAYGVTFETGLVNQIAADVLDRAGGLPILQYALRELWQVCVQENAGQQLTWAGYRQIGGVIGALEKRANLLYESFSSPDQILVQRIFAEELVQLNDDQSVTRRRTTWERLAAMGDREQVHALVEQLADQRLVVTDETTVEVAHEALLSEWGLLRDWLERDREKIRLRRDLQSSYDAWQTSYGKSDDALLMKALLSAIEEKLDWQHLPEAEYIQQSLARRDRLAQQEVERERKLRELAEAKAQAEAQLRELAEVRVTEEAAKAGLAEQRAVAEQNRAKSEGRLKWLAIVSTGVVSLLAGSVVMSWRNAEYQEVDALLKSAQAQFVSNRSSLDTLLAAVKADERRRKSIWVRGDSELKTEALQVLQQAGYWVRERDRLEGQDAHKKYVQSVSFSPIDDFIATASFDNTVKLWNARGNLENTLPHEAEVTHVSFHPTQNIIFSGSKDKKVRLWRRDGTLVIPPIVHKTTVWSMSFDPKTQTLATACEDGSVLFWDLQGQPKQIGFPGTPQNPWKPQPQGKKRINSISFSPKGDVIAVASENGTVNLWDRKGKATLLKGHMPDLPIYKVRFSPDGSTIATASDDGTAILWNTQTGIQLQRLSGHKSGVHDINFHPEFSRSVRTKVMIATASLDGTVKTWNSQGDLIETLQGHTDRVNSVSFNKNGTLIASGSNDQKIRLWQVNNLEMAILAGHRGKVYQTAISPNAQTIVSSGDDGTKIWFQGKVEDLGAGYAIDTFNNAEKSLFALSFSFSQPEKNQPRVKLFDWTGKPQAPKNITQPKILSLSWGLQGDLAFSDVNGNVWMMNAKESTPRLLENQGTGINSLRFSPNGKYLATGNNKGIVKIRNLSKNMTEEFSTTQSRLTTLRFASNGNTLATSSEDGTIKFWELNGKLIRTLKGEKEVREINFSSFNDSLAAANTAGYIAFWHQNGELITKLTGHEGAVSAAVFSVDGKTLVTAGDDGRILRWENVHRLDLENQRRRACSWLQDYLTLRKDTVKLCN